jgi:hypothetical protein
LWLLKGAQGATHAQAAMAKKRHLPCRFTSIRRKCLAAFLALPLSTGLKAP